MHGQLDNTGLEIFRQLYRHICKDTQPPCCVQIALRQSIQGHFDVSGDLRWTIIGENSSTLSNPNVEVARDWVVVPQGNVEVLACIDLRGRSPWWLAVKVDFDCGDGPAEMSGKTPHRVSGQHRRLVP